MSMPSPDNVLAALRDFNARIDALDPEASPWGEIVPGLPTRLAS
jgi:hypothetical protein